MSSVPADLDASYRSKVGVDVIGSLGIEAYGRPVDV